jgi:hypothetical protein
LLAIATTGRCGTTSFSSDKASAMRKQSFLTPCVLCFTAELAKRDALDTFPPPIPLVPSKAEDKPEHKEAETKLQPSGPDSPTTKKHAMVFDANPKSLLRGRCARGRTVWRDVILICYGS